MAFGVQLHVWGERALFTRPETKVERVSYDVITPSAARGVLESIHWKPAISWVVDRIRVLKPIRFESIRRNEVGQKIPEVSARRAMNEGSLDGLVAVVEEQRQQRASTVLKDVAYIIEAHFVMTSKAGPDDSPGKHLDVFNRRIAKGQCFHRPCLGTREFAAYFGPVSEQPPTPIAESRDLGLMLHDIDFGRGMTPSFFQARMINGIIDVPHLQGAELRA